MKVQVISASSVSTQRNQQSNNLRRMESNPIHSGMSPSRSISFTGNNPDHVILVGGEVKGLQAVGGVATVEYDQFFRPRPDGTPKQYAGIFPYHNAQLIYESTGVAISKTEDGKPRVSVHQFPQDYPDATLRGQYFWTGIDLDATDIESVRRDSSKYLLLDLVEEKQAPWDSSQKISLFKVKQKGVVNKIPADIFLTYSETSGIMRKPYDTAAGGYSSKTLEQLANMPTLASEFRPSEYAQIERTTAEFLKTVERVATTTDGTRFSPKSVNCADTQFAMLPYYMKMMGLTDIEPYTTVHNGHPGYTGETSGRQIFSDLLLGYNEAERGQIINDLLGHKNYVNALVSNNEDAFFQRYIPQLVDDNGRFNPLLVSMQMAVPSEETLRKDPHAVGFVKGLNTVSKGYAEGLAYNENIHSGVQSMWNSLYKRGLAEGILNPLNDPAVSGLEDDLLPDGRIKQKHGYLNGFENTYQLTYPDGQTEVVSPFRRFERRFFYGADGAVNVTADSLRHVDEVRLDNQINFLQRLQGKFDADDFAGELREVDSKTGGVKVTKGAQLRNLLINGLANKDVELIGHISQDVVQKFVDAKQNGTKPPAVVVSWGRLDDQKALHEVMMAFKKLKETNADAVLVLGGQAAYEPNGDLQPCSKKIISMAQEYAREFDGSFVFMNSFAPGKVLSGVATFANFPSEFAPCELTDVENKKYFSPVIVTDCQGLGDKNFDPANPGEMAKVDAYKTKHEYYGITKNILENEGATREIFHNGVPELNIEGYDRIYAKAAKIVKNRFISSGMTHGDALIDRYTGILNGLIKEDAVNGVQDILKALNITDAEKAKLEGLTSSLERNDAQMVSDFAQGRLLSAKENKRIVQIIEASGLSDVDKTRFKDLLSGKTQANIEDSLLRVIFNKANLQDGNVKLIGDLTDAHINLLKQYLGDVNQANRKMVEEQLINAGMIDNSQIKIAKEMFNLDIVHDFILSDGKLQHSYETLFNHCRDELLSSEAADCMRRAIAETPENRLAMLKNHLLLDTTWTGNAELTQLSREGRPASAAYLYDEIERRSPHPDELTNKKGRFLDRLIEAIKPTRTNTSRPNGGVQAAANNAQNVVEQAASSGGMSKGLKIALGIGAGLLALGGVYFAMKKSDVKTNSDGDTFKQTATPASNHSAKKNASPALQNPFLATK